VSRGHDQKATSKGGFFVLVYRGLAWVHCSPWAINVNEAMIPDWQRMAYWWTIAEVHGPKGNGA